MCGYNNIPVCLLFTPARKRGPTYDLIVHSFLHKEWRQKCREKKIDYITTHIRGEKKS